MVAHLAAMARILLLRTQVMIHCIPKFLVKSMVLMKLHGLINIAGVIIAFDTDVRPTMGFGFHKALPYAIECRPFRTFNNLR